MLGASFRAAPLEFSAGGIADEPAGRMEVINVKGPGDFAAQLLVDDKTYLPALLKWRAKEPLVLTSRPEPGADPADVAAQARALEASRKIVEYQLAYSDYRPVGDLRLPHHLQQTIAGQPSTDVTIQTYTINPTIDPKRFETVK